MQKRMTPHFLSRVQTYVRYLARRLGLENWSVEVWDDHAEDGAAAEIFLTYGRFKAVVKLHHEFPLWNPYERRQTLCHELAHIYFGGLQSLMEDLEEVLSTEAFKLHQAAFLRALEYSVEKFANAFSPLVATMEEFEDALPQGIAA